MQSFEKEIHIWFENEEKNKNFSRTMNPKIQKSINKKSKVKIIKKKHECVWHFVKKKQTKSSFI